MPSQFIYVYVKYDKYEKEDEEFRWVKIERNQLEPIPEDYKLYVAIPFNGTDKEFERLAKYCYNKVLSENGLKLAKERYAAYTLFLPSIEASRILGKPKARFNPRRINTRYFVYNILDTNPNMNLNSDEAFSAMMRIASNIGLTDESVVREIYEFVKNDKDAIYDYPYEHELEPKHAADVLKINADKIVVKNEATTIEDLKKVRKEVDDAVKKVEDANKERKVKKSAEVEKAKTSLNELDKSINKMLDAFLQEFNIPLDTEDNTQANDSKVAKSEVKDEDVKEDELDKKFNKVLDALLQEITMESNNKNNAQDNTQPTTNTCDKSTCPCNQECRNIPINSTMPPATTQYNNLPFYASRVNSDYGNARAGDIGLNTNLGYGYDVYFNQNNDGSTVVRPFPFQHNVSYNSHILP